MNLHFDPQAASHNALAGLEVEADLLRLSRQRYHEELWAAADIDFGQIVQQSLAELCPAVLDRQLHDTFASP